MPDRLMALHFVLTEILVCDAPAETHWGPRIDKTPIKAWIGAVITVGMTH